MKAFYSLINKITPCSKVILFVVVFNFFSNSLFSNVDDIYSMVRDSSSIIQNKLPQSIHKQIDCYDILKNLFHINLRIDSSKTKGLGPFFSIIPAAAYTLATGWTGAITTSTSFYTDYQKNKYSNITANVYYSQFHQYWMNINSSVYLDKYKIHFFGDWRYYKFPTYTYGLGNHSSLTSALRIDYSYIRFYQYTYHEFFDNFFLGIGYNLDLYWDITTNSDTGKVYSQFIRDVTNSRSIASGVSANFLYDTRKNSVNPIGGTYFSVQYRPNFIFLGSDLNWQSMLIDIREYVKFPASSGNVLAFWSYNNLTLVGKPAYLELPTIGWDDYNNTGRGYVQGRYTGNNLVYLETEYRFHITDNGLLGGVVFANGESILKDINSQLHTIIPGYGAGIRIKFNKTSDTNACIDYGFGIGGSHGFFFNLGEVF